MIIFLLNLCTVHGSPGQLISCLQQLFSSLIPAFKPIIHSRKSPQKSTEKLSTYQPPNPRHRKEPAFEKCVLLTHVNPRNFMKPFPLPKGSALGVLFGGMAIFRGSSQPTFPLCSHLFCQWVLERVLGVTPNLPGYLKH